MKYVANLKISSLTIKTVSGFPFQSNNFYCAINNALFQYQVSSVRREPGTLNCLLLLSFARGESGLKFTCV